MNKKLKLIKIEEILNNLFPDPEIPLQHKNPYTLLVAVLLSAQCTDERVNKVTPKLFERGDSPEKMIQFQVEEIEEIIKPCGLGPTKSKAIWNLSQKLIHIYGGEVPSTFEELESLPGVGHKTASVVVSQAFKRPAFPVDTHIHRLAERWGLSKGNNVKETEKDLKALFPKIKEGGIFFFCAYFSLHRKISFSTFEAFFNFPNLET